MYNLIKTISRAYVIVSREDINLEHLQFKYTQKQSKINRISNDIPIKYNY